MNRKFNKLVIMVLVIAVVTATQSMTFASASANSVPDQVSQIIQKLNESESGIPSTVTKDDIDKVINEGGQEGVKALAHVYETSVPVPAPEKKQNETEKYNKSSNERFSYVYNFKTREATYMDGREFNLFTDTSLNSASQISPQAYPTDWFTPDPQNYSDTRSTCKLIIYSESKKTSFGGTGWLATNKDVVTAGHCIYNSEFGSNKWCGYIIVMPSYSADYTGGYYGSLRDATSVEVGGNWKNNFDSAEDWGMIHLTNSFSCGYYTPMAPGDNINGWGIRIEGYDGDYVNLRNTEGNVTSASGTVMNEDAKSYGGMSGGPVFEGRGYVIGINCGHFTDTGNAYGVKIDNWLYNKIMSYR